MCLAIPGRVIEISEDKNTAMVNFDGVKKKVIVALLPNVRPGSFIIVHAGCAIEEVDEQRAKESIALWHQVMENEGGSSEEYLSR